MTLHMSYIICLLLFLSCTLSVNQRDSNRLETDIEQVDSTLIGMTVSQAIDRLKLDTSQYFAFDEPPMILRGLHVSLGDTCQITLFVERTSIIDKLDSVVDNWDKKYRYIINKKIIGVSWRKSNQNKSKSIGATIPWIHN